MNNGQSAEVDEEVVMLLRSGRHFVRISAEEVETGPGLSRTLDLGQRVIFDDDLEFTYLVESVGPLVAGRQPARLRRGRPILDVTFVEHLFGADE